MSSNSGGKKEKNLCWGENLFVLVYYFRGSRGGTGMRDGVMEVVTAGQVLTGRGSVVKGYSSKREGNGMPIGKTKMLPAMSITARYVGSPLKDAGVCSRGLGHGFRFLLERVYSLGPKLWHITGGCTGGYPAWMVSLGADSTYIPVKAQLWCWWTWGHVCMVFLNTCCKSLFVHIYCIVVFILMSSLSWQLSSPRPDTKPNAPKWCNVVEHCFAVQHVALWTTMTRVVIAWLPKYANFLCLFYSFFSTITLVRVWEDSSQLLISSDMYWVASHSHNMLLLKATEYIGHSWANLTTACCNIIDRACSGKVWESAVLQGDHDWWPSDQVSNSCCGFKHPNRSLYCHPCCVMSSIAYFVWHVGFLDTQFYPFLLYFLLNGHLFLHRRLLLESEDVGTVFATDAILSTLMCAPRSVYSWDIVAQRVGNKLFFDKRDSSFDLLTVRIPSLFKGIWEM